MAAQYASAEISRGARAGRAKQGVFALQRSGHGSVAGIAGSALAVSDTDHQARDPLELGKPDELCLRGVVSQRRCMRIVQSLLPFKSQARSLRLRCLGATVLLTPARL